MTAVKNYDVMVFFFLKYMYIKIKFVGLIRLDLDVQQLAGVISAGRI